MGYSNTYSMYITRLNELLSLPLYSRSLSLLEILVQSA